MHWHYCPMFIHPPIFPHSISQWRDMYKSHCHIETTIAEDTWSSNHLNIQQRHPKTSCGHKAHSSFWPSRLFRVVESTNGTRPGRRAGCPSPHGTGRSKYEVFVGNWALTMNHETACFGWKSTFSIQPISKIQSLIFCKKHTRPAPCSFFPFQLNCASPNFSRSNPPSPVTRSGLGARSKKTNNADLGVAGSCLF